jgi:STE24 endopeptidase
MNAYRRIKTDPARWFAADEVAKAKEYQRPLTRMRVAKTVVGLAVILLIVSTHAAPRLVDALGVTLWPLRLLVVFGFLVVAFTLADLPFSIWTTFVHEKRWEFSTETPAGFVADEIKSLLLSFVLFGGIGLLLYWAIRSSELWWIEAWIGFLLFSVVLALIFPVVILPMFNKFSALEDSRLAERLRALARTAGLNISEVQVMDASKRTRKDNAFFAGMGRTRRVVLYDNLLTQPESSIASIVAHEIGHWRRRHIARQIVFGTVLSFVLFVLLRFVSTWDAALRWAGVPSLSDPASLPLVALVFVAGNSVLAFVQNWVSRAYERQADVVALELTEDPEAFVKVMRELATKNLSDLAPSWWSYVRASHPPAAERLELAEVWRSERTAEPAGRA